jgi:metallo-beta-lactamase family protein
MPKLSFHGGVPDVTGSCHLIQFESGGILVDCGMHQGERMCSRTNFEDFDFDISEVKAVIITHAHYDHHGRLPLLVKRGYNGPIYCTPPTKPLMELVLRDGFHIMQENAKECGDEVLYEQEHLDATLGMVKTMNYHTDFMPVPGITCSFFDAGHIMGSAFLKVEGDGVSAVFSGDIGNDDNPILPSTEDLPAVDYVVTETTYGNRDHEPTATRNRNLGKAVSTILNRKGTVIIPAFSLERTQELLYALDRLFAAKEIPKVPVYLDSPLAIKATQVYREYKQYLQFNESILESQDRDFFSFPGLTLTLTRDESKNINEDNRPKIIIAGSGMMTGGRVLHHLRRYLPEPDSGVIIIGYQAEQTLGRQIQDGAKEVSIHNKPVPVNAEIFEIESFSAHGDRGKMSRWLQGVKESAKKIFLVHGDPEAKKMFKDQMEKEGFEGRVEIPEKNQKIEL